MEQTCLQEAVWWLRTSCLQEDKIFLYKPPAKSILTQIRMELLFGVTSAILITLSHHIENSNKIFPKYFRNFFHSRIPQNFRRTFTSLTGEESYVKCWNSLKLDRLKKPGVFIHYIGKIGRPLKIGRITINSKGPLECLVYCEMQEAIQVQDP